ncbi:hypothetical protein SAMN06265360_101142 [Haloechinothrix alba]|uniref:Uncharacterized protein n=1 Tax=Haloechinothrix alba TaxID=664784 RepID=A0A238V1J6_9PSEU|nr:DUF6247 family protein [Haloechinothrix alba]SNR27934.1 hypothetical protein SAMN06265360_101142 [Haloechinothrix alba]
MASPDASPPNQHPSPPAADPASIRECLTPTLAAEFDHEWQIVLDRVKESQDLTDLHALLNKWQHTAFLELREPGAYHRVLAKAEEVIRTGHNPRAVQFEDLRDAIQQRRST